MDKIFYIASFMAILSALLAITRRNLMYALLFMILTMLSLSVIFFVSGAPYVAALEIMVYAGAIMVLFIFVVMMLNPEKVAENDWQKFKSASWVLPLIISVCLLFCFIYAIYNTGLHKKNYVIQPKQVGISMYTSYLLGVEIAGVLLLAAIVGAYHIGRLVRKPYHRYLNKG